MKVLLINGSPRPHGCTYTALKETEKTLNEAGIETEIFHIGAKAIQGCTDCGACAGGKPCVFDKEDEVVAIARKKVNEADGIIVGSPVYFAGPNGNLTAFMNRLFYGGSVNCAGKPAAAIVSARRAGTTATLDVLNKYFIIRGMPIVPSQYWCMVHGNSPDEVAQDKEGLQIMRTLGRNMAWLLKCIAAGKAAGISLPEREPRVSTNFVR